MGSRFVAEALRHGKKVVALARTSAKETAAQRVLQELRENLSAQEIEKYRSHLTIHDYDVSKLHLGLESDIVDSLSKTCDNVFNFVGDTNFFPRDVKRLFETNVDGSSNLIKSLCMHGAIFNHISTAYVCGDRSGTIHEDELNVGQQFKNHYEESKMVAEEQVVTFCKKNSISYNIFRPSIVIRSHIAHGKMPNLNHFYSFISLIDILRQDAVTRSHASTKDTVTINVRFLGKRKSTLNFVDLDYAIKAMFYIVEHSESDNKTYHLVNPKPMNNQEFLDTMMQLYNINGFSIVEDKKDMNKLNFFERLIKRGLANYIDYFFVNPCFDDKNTRSALKGSGLKCPTFNGEYIRNATGHFE